MSETHVNHFDITLATLFNVDVVCGALWFLYLYVLILSQGSRRSVLHLNRLERRCLRDETTEPSSSHRAWLRFRAKHLSTARAVERAHFTVFRPALWLAVILVAGLLGLAGVVAGAAAFGHASRAWDGAAFALAFFAPVPLLLTALLQRLFWHRRARSEWQVVLLGEQLAADAESELDQDYIARHTARILTALGRRLERAGARRGEGAEGRAWLLKTQPAIHMRVELVTTDATEKRVWTGWVATWLDQVSDAFGTRRQGSQQASTTIARLPTGNPDLVGLGTLVAACCLFGALGVWMAMLSSGFDASALLSTLDSTAGRLTTFIGFVATLLSIVGYRRGRVVEGA
ncbi:hypothetical protein ACLBWP_04435 [Microbacterium sp. M1A1_1b]